MRYLLLICTFLAAVGAVGCFHADEAAPISPPSPTSAAATSPASEQTSRVTRTVATTLGVPDPIFQSAVIKEPVVKQLWQNNESEHQITNENYAIIVPEGYASIADHLSEFLPSCEAFIETFLGYSSPWSKYIVHIGLYDLYKAKMEGGVVYMGVPEKMLSNWVENADWKDATGPCGGFKTLAHESVHTFQSDNTPAWLKEGQADYVAEVVLGDAEYHCHGSDMEVCTPNGCRTYLYWNLSDQEWGGKKHLYYKTGVCFWQGLTEIYGASKVQEVARSIILDPLEGVGSYPFSDETNARIIEHHFSPILGDRVWSHISKYGILN